LLFTALQCEKNPLNLQNIIWVILCFIYEEIQNNNSIANKYVVEILDIIKNHGGSPKGEYTPPVFNTIFEFLSSIVPLYDTLILGEEVPLLF
jgi:hypothetical protein